MPPQAVTIDPPCDVCAGAGWIVVEHVLVPLDKRLQRCVCGLAADAEREQRLAQAARARARDNLRDELGALSHCRFKNFYAARPLRDVTWEGNEITVIAQKGFLKKAIEVCMQYAQDPQGWLYIHGAYGAGKSHLAAAIANVRLLAGDRVIYRSTPGLLDDIKRGFSTNTSSDLVDEVLAVDLLVLDDIGAEQVTAWSEPLLFRLINERQNKHTVLTSNLSIDDLNGRVASRIAGLTRNRSVWLPVSDYRKIGV